MERDRHETVDILARSFVPTHICMRRGVASSFRPVWIRGLFRVCLRAKRAGVLCEHMIVLGTILDQVASMLIASQIQSGIFADRFHTGGGPPPVYFRKPWLFGRSGSQISRVGVKDRSR